MIPVELSGTVADCWQPLARLAYHPAGPALHYPADCGVPLRVLRWVKYCLAAGGQTAAIRLDGTDYRYRAAGPVPTAPPPESKIASPLKHAPPPPPSPSPVSVSERTPAPPDPDPDPEPPRGPRRWSVTARNSRGEPFTVELVADSQQDAEAAIKQCGGIKPQAVPVRD